MGGTLKWCVQIQSIEHEGTCGTVRKREFVFPGRSWVGHFRNEKRIARSFANSEEQNAKMSARGLRLKESLGKANVGNSLDLIGTKLRETSESAIQLVFLVMNLMVVYRRKAKAFFAALMETLFELVRKSFITQILQPMAV